MDDADAVPRLTVLNADKVGGGCRVVLDRDRDCEKRWCTRWREEEGWFTGLTTVVRYRFGRRCPVFRLGFESADVLGTHESLELNPTVLPEDGIDE